MFERNDPLGTGPLTRGDILGVVLAGGKSRRFGQDKALAPLGGLRLIDHVIHRARLQTGLLAISGHDYGLNGMPLIPDAMISEGPLSGILSALAWAESNHFAAVATFSCDAPFFPADLVVQLAAHLPHDGLCVSARSGEARHPAFALWRVSAREPLQRVYEAGERALRIAQDKIRAVTVDFAPGPAPDDDVFYNINHMAELTYAEAWLACGDG